MSTQSRTVQLANAFSTQPAHEPVPRSLLLSLANEPAAESLGVEATVTHAARTVQLSSRNDIKFSLAPSEYGEGMYELPAGLHPIAGLPGKSIDRLSSRSLDCKESREAIKVPHVDGFIPPTEAIVYNPLPVFGRRRATSMLRSRGPGHQRKHRCSAASDNHTTIFGGDNRINVYPSGYPERCVCRIEVYVQEYDGGPWAFQKRGTGFIAGVRLMMTSGHMHPNAPYVRWMIKVVPGYYDGKSVYGASFHTYVSHTHYWESDTGNDMMACRLYDAIGNTTGYFGATTYNDDWEDWCVWSMCGYPYDRGETRPTFQGGIPVRDDDDGGDIALPDGSEFDTTQIENEADEASGASGSPLYSWFKSGNLYAIGVHHGTETDYIFPFSSETLSAAAGGPGLPGIINWARSWWP